MTKWMIFYIVSFIAAFGNVQAQQKQTFKFQTLNSSQDHEEGTIIVKLKKTTNSFNLQNQAAPNTLGKENGANNLLAIQKEIESLKVISTKKPFESKGKGNLRVETPQVDLSNIYFIKIPSNQNLEEAINLLRQNENVIYAEPYYNHQLLVVPNDPNASPSSSFQYQLKLIRAYEAWDIQRGDTNVIIGIIDTGVLTTHADLASNIKKNKADPINGIDDDGDGFIDNYTGWDFADSDNDPTANGHEHGTQVSGCSNASTNNGIGVAGTSFNSKFLPLKIYRTSDNKFSMGFEAIAYAADHGCKVINLSWGQAGGYSSFEQDVINYAVIEKDVVIVAAAGNTPDELDFYPASYNNVLSVGATNALDQKASFSTYSNKIDICAPGDAIGSTNNAGYGAGSGTSFSSPTVAGAAALVRAKFPKLNALQVAEQLRVTSDDIFNTPANLPFKEKLGKGRLNMFRALTDSVTPAVRFLSYKCNNGVGNYAFYDDTVKLLCEFKNYLFKTGNLKVTLSSASPYVTITQNQFIAGKISTLETKNNYLAPFEFYLSPNTPDSQKITFRLGFEDGAYSDYQYFEIYTSPDYIDAAFNSISLTTTSRGRLGFKNDSRTLGIGLLVNNQQVLGSAGLMLATSPTKVSNNVISNFSTGLSDQNLTGTRQIKYFKESYANVETRGTLVDTISNVDKIGLIVTQKEYGWKDSLDSKFVIVEYFITNYSGANIPSLYTGLFADWNIGSMLKNRADWDASNNLGYAYSSESGNEMIGVSLLTPGTPAYYALDNVTDNGNGILLTDGFTKAEKFKTLSMGIGKSQAGISGEGSDISQVLGAMISNLGNKQSTKIAFAIIIGKSLSELQTSAQRAKVKFNEYQLNPPVLQKINFCSNNSATIARSNNKPFKLYSSLPAATPFYSGTSYHTPALNSNQSYYITNTDEGFESEPTTVKVSKDDAFADFVMNSDTLDLLYSSKVNFSDVTPNSINWKWTFSNGYQSTNKSPIKVFNKQGIYTIKLIAGNKTGCSDTIIKNLVVVSTSPKPKISPLYICPNENAEIQPSNGSTFNFYDSFPLTTPVYTGYSYMLFNLTSSKTIWVTNIDSTYESSPLEFKVNVWKDFAQFKFSKDTLNLDESNSIKVTDLTANAISWTWINGMQSVESTNSTTFSFNKVGNYPITLIATNITGCADTITRNLVVGRKSPTPKVEDLTICKNTSVTLSPQNSSKYRFYNKLPLTIPLGEGKTFETGLITSSQTFYVTSVDSILESTPAMIKINLLNYEGGFTMSEDTLNLNENNSILFNSTGSETLKWQWSFDNGKTDTVSSVTTTFDYAGVYKIILATENIYGCKDTVTKDLVVIKSGYQLDQEIEVFPVPSRKYVTIKSTLPEKEPVDIQIFNYKGEEINLTKSQLIGRELIKIDASNYPQGLYYIRLQTAHESVLKKFIIVK